MKCENPTVSRKIIKGTEYRYQFPCGKCGHCRRTKQSQTKLRILLETTLHPENAFVTLTYNDIFVPKELYKDDAQRFLKRLRKQVKRKYGKEATIKHYLVGEYGSRTGRPHFHVILFGYPHTDIESLAVAWRRNIGSARKPKFASLGFIQSREVTPERAGYVVKYTTKFLESNTSTNGSITPEFAIMSKRSGGIGLGYLRAIVRSIQNARNSHKPNITLAEYFDRYVGSINIGRSRMSIDPYLRSKIYKYLHELDGSGSERSPSSEIRRDRIAARRKAMIQSRRVPLNLEQDLEQQIEINKEKLSIERKKRATKRLLKT